MERVLSFAEDLLVIDIRPVLNLRLVNGQNNLQGRFGELDLRNAFGVGLTHGRVFSHPDPAAGKRHAFKKHLRGTKPND